MWLVCVVSVCVEWVVCVSACVWLVCVWSGWLVCVWSGWLVCVSVWSVWSYFKEVLGVRAEGWVEHQMVNVGMMTRLMIVVVNEVLNIVM